MKEITELSTGGSTKEGQVEALEIIILHPNFKGKKMNLSVIKTGPISRKKKSRARAQWCSLVVLAMRETGQEDHLSPGLEE